MTFIYRKILSNNEINNIFLLIKKHGNFDYPNKAKSIKRYNYINFNFYRSISCVTNNNKIIFIYITLINITIIY